MSRRLVTFVECALRFVELAQVPTLVWGRES
jgi:hypothetical protein